MSLNSSDQISDMPSFLYLSTAAFGVAGSTEIFAGAMPGAFGPSVYVDGMQNWQMSSPRHGPGDWTVPGQQGSLPPDSFS